MPDLRVLVQRRENDELRNCLAYLEKREAQMQYPAFQAQGWPIGSGAVESACGERQQTGGGSQVEGRGNALGAVQRKPDAGLAEHCMQRPLGGGVAPDSQAAQGGGLPWRKGGAPAPRNAWAEERSAGGEWGIRGQIQPG